MKPRLVALLAVLLIASTPGAPGEIASASERASASPTAKLPSLRAPALKVDVLARGLDHPWEVQQLPSGQLLLTQRERRALTIVDTARKRRYDLSFPNSSIWVGGETGLLGLAIDPAFSRNRRIYTCSGWQAGGRRDVRVVAWTLDPTLRRASLTRALVTGLPVSTGRHGGCRLLIAKSGALMIGTGDAAIGTNPRNLDSLGGKVLRVDRATGRPLKGNPFFSGKGNRRLVFTYGHRNVQGLAMRPDGSILSVEHGSDRDDEVNLERAGRDFGWNPVPGYNESVPMTDQRLPGRQFEAVWRSGFPTIAPSGADIVRGAGWGALRGTLAVGVLKGKRVMFLTIGSTGGLRAVTVPAALTRYGRIRDVTATSRGTLLLTTDNGDGRDVLLRVRPAS